MHFSLAIDCEYAQLLSACKSIFPSLGRILVRGWPEIDRWKESVIPFPGLAPHGASLEFELDENATSRTLSAELSVIYELRDEESFAAVLWLALQHSELSGPFFPHTADKEFIQDLVEESDYFAYRSELSAIESLPWFIAVGIAGNEAELLTLGCISKDFASRFFQTFVVDYKVLLVA